MNYELEIQKSMPNFFFTLNGDRPPLVAGSGSATYRTTNLNLQAFSAFVSGRELIPFTYELWYLPRTVSTESVVLGHNAEGILFDGTSFILRVKYEGGTTLEASYTPPEIKSFHLALVYDIESYALYVDGEIVGSVVADRSAKYLTSTAGSQVGHGAAQGVYDSVALYYRALSGGEVRLHNSWQKGVPTSHEIASSLGGTTYDLSYQSVSILQSAVFSSGTWDQGLSDNLTDSDFLIGNTDGGTWQASVPVESIVSGTTEGLHLTYEGQGVTMSYSVDGTTWTPIANKRTVLEGTTADGTTLYIKLEIIEGGFVSSLRIDALESRVLFPVSGQRQLEFQYTSFDQTPGHQLDYHIDQGAEIVQGFIELQPDDTPTPESSQTVEVWAKVTSADGWFMGISGSQYVSVVAGSYTFAGMTAYRNGQPVSNGVQPTDEWAHYVFVLNTSANTAIRFGQKIAGTDPLAMSIGHVAVYPTAMTAPQVLALYNQNIGAPVVRVNDTSTIGVTESVPTTQFYALTWSNSAA